MGDRAEVNCEAEEPAAEVAHTADATAADETQVPEETAQDLFQILEAQAEDEWTANYGTGSNETISGPIPSAHRDDE